MLRGAVITLGSGLFYAALAILPLVEATAILFIQPLILTAFAAVFLGERVGWLRWAAVFTGLIGAYIIIGNGEGEGGCEVHNPGYDFNDEILPLGASYYARVAESWLSRRNA